MHEDALAIEAIKAGDRERYAELVQRYERMVYAIAWSRLGQRDLCEEAAQETFIQGFRFLTALREPSKYAGWIARIARNVARTLALRRKRALENEQRWRLERGTQAVQSSVSEREESPADVLQETLRTLPGKHRECLVLYYLQERDTRECAEIMGIREGTFRVRLHRARNALREELQSRMESSLRQLRPRGGFDKRVMSFLPAAPLASGLGSVLALVTMKLLSMAPLLLLVGWAHRQFAQNFRSAQNYRKSLLRRHMPRQFAMMIVAGVGGVILYHRCGTQIVGLVLALFILPSLFKSFLFLRVNHTGFARANAFGHTAMFLAFSVLALEGRSYSWTFFAAMLVYNIGLWLTRRSMPSRRDYHLALRAAFDELGHIEEPVSANRVATPQQMREFARLLGKLFLIVDYSIRREACTLAMPSITMNIWRMLFPWREFAVASRIVLKSDGMCSVTLSNTDWREIRAVSLGRHMPKAELEAKTSQAIEQAWACFLNGHEQKAMTILQPKPDEEILIRPTHELRSMKVIYIASIICAVLMLAGLLAFRARHRWRKASPHKPPTLRIIPEPVPHNEHTGLQDADASLE